MDRYRLYLEDLKSAWKRLQEAVNKTQKNRDSEDYPYFRDSAIQRFEFTFEILWKTIKVYLEREGLYPKSPRSSFREFFSLGYLTEQDMALLFRMIEDRNATAHTYRERVAEEIFSRLNQYLEITEKIIHILEEIP
ncbi:MAG: nucleotidyltransferase substrate binding protein [Candidatus Atribacteria bacterium]|nr:nucleotidyltransferase substrate binding protein [Candidatus Atribacteria bacterium]MCD6349194.1 nucleotidyltransferase substrate binding protein [Candidatus Atribacteria bacterium]